jgi:hypothetical protein
VALCWGIRNPQALDAHGGIDYQSTYIIDFYIEHVPTMARLPYTRSVIVHVCVSLVELLLWTVMGRVPIGAHKMSISCANISSKCMK